MPPPRISLRSAPSRDRSAPDWPHRPRPIRLRSRPGCRACDRPCPSPSVPSSSSWRARVAAFRTNSWVWPRTVLPVTARGVQGCRDYALFGPRFPPLVSERQGAHAVGGAEQTDGCPPPGEDADADDARPLVDLGFERDGIVDRQAVHVKDEAAVVGDDAVASLGTPADRRELAR